jgi:BolA protein
MFARRLAATHGAAPRRPVYGFIAAIRTDADIKPEGRAVTMAARLPSHGFSMGCDGLSDNEKALLTDAAGHDTQEGMSMTDTLRAKLTAAFAPVRLDIVDESERHRGHGGWREGGESHFRVEIVSAAFEGLSRIERQRRVFDLLADEMAGPIHALALKTRTPREDA